MGASALWSSISAETYTLLGWLLPVVVLALALALVERLLPLGLAVVRRSRLFEALSVRIGIRGSGDGVRTARVRGGSSSDSGSGEGR